MKTQIKRFSKSALAVVLTLCMLVSCMTVGIIATDAAKDNSETLGVGAQGSVYVDISGTTNWGTNVSYIVGKSGYSTSYNMTQLSGTKLYYKNIGSDWSDATEYGFHNGAWGASNGANQKISDRWGSTKHTSVESSWNFYSGSTYLVVITGSNNDYARNQSYCSGGYSDFNKTLTIKTALKSGSTYAETNTKLGTFSASNAVKITDDSTTTAQSISQTNGTGTITTARTNTATISQTVVRGYTFKGWKVGSLDTSGSSLSTGDYSFTNTGDDTTLYAYYEQNATTYNNIAVAAKGSTDGSTYNTTLSGTPATISANSYTTGSSALNISAGTVSGYSFAQWKVTAGSGTIGSATTANTTFTPSASNTTVTAQYKKNYTFSNGTTDTHGTVTVPSGTVLAGASYSGKVTPADGYKIKTLTVGGVAVSAAAGKTFAYTYSGTTGSSTTGTSTPISVVATFEANTAMNLYIAGRFRVRPSAGSSSWTTTYASGSDWNATSTNIKFTYLSGTTYKVDTYASLAELSAKPTNNQDPWFFVYDKTNSKAWHPTTQNRELGTTTEYNLTTNTDTYNVKFNSSSNDSPVTIYFDYNTKRLWYSVPDLYDVTVASVTGGSVTASPARAEAGTEITLTVSPATGYELTSLTAKDSDNATVTITSNNKFTMPAKNVTVTPVFSKKKFSGLTAVGKYSTTAANDASYSNAMSSNPATITNTNNVTQLDGTPVSVPGTDPKGYVFAGWYTTTGSFANAANKDTTFYPNAANAVAIAKYNKIFTIETSVDSTGTGAGTVSISITSGSVDNATDKILAGGSYTITATAKSGSAIESVKVNGTSKGANATTNISSVSENQTVVVKFASKAHLIGGLATNAWNEPGDAMKSNADGTKFTITISEKDAGTYEFKHYVGTGSSGTYDATAIPAASQTLNGIATLDNSGTNGNYKLVTTVKSNIILESDGTKFTSITVTPANVPTYNVTLTQSADYTITATYLNVDYTTAGKNANVTVPVYKGTAFSYKVTPASGMYLSGVAQSNSVALSPAFSATTHANSYTGTVSSVSKAFAVSATAANKISITAKTNKSDRGTVTVDNNTAYPGQIVKVTVTPKNGVLKSLTVKDASGADVTLRDSAQTSSLNYSQLDVATVTALMYDFFNKSGEALGAAVNDEAVGADTVKYFTMPNSSVTVSATFDPYSAESTWYYNGYDTSGNAVSGYHARQMTEAMVGGEKFSYYEVSGRTGTDDQLMTVYNGAASSGTRYVYFVRPNNYGDGWSASNNPKAYFWNTLGAVGNAWPGTEMSWQWNNGYGQGVYKIAIPEGATSVLFNDATNNEQHQTVDIDLTTTSGAYYVGKWNSTYSKYDYGTWNTGRDDQGWVASGTEYFYQNSTHNGDYTGDFNTKGFHSHNTASKEFAKPKDLGTNTGDYYINVLYPNTTYTINGVTKKTGSNPMIIWSAEPLAGDDEAVKIYAKDGSIRSDSNGATYANIADTKIYAANGTTTVGTKVSGTITNQTYETYKVDKGETIVIKTTIGATDTGTLSDAADLKAKYYVRGFCVNGEVSELLEPNDTGVYTLTYKVPEDYEGKNIEITPIYYLKDTTANPIVTYRVTGFTDELKAVGSGKPGWGDTLYTYPFYGKLGGQNNAFGAYPGQPMVYYKGQYQIQIPQKSTAWDIYYGDSALSGYSGNTDKANAVANTPVSGVTMSNGYWDSVHKTIMGYGDNSTSADHVQTYDYGDFYKIFNEKKPVDNIVFDFKYRTKKHNFENQPDASTTKSDLDTDYGTNGNGFELLTNFHGRTVDLFGTPLSGAASDPEQTTPVYVVSIGGVNGSAGVENIAGYYATEWVVYGSTNGTDYNRITDGKTNGKSSIPPEVLVLNDDNDTSFSTTTYPSAVDTTTKSFNITDWKDLYTALEAYRGKPVYISYEAADAQQAQGMYYTGTGGATRNDGRWLYSKNGENITSKIRVDVSHDSGATYVTNPAEGEGHVDGLSAYFTNADAYQKTTYATTIDPDKTFDFEAKTTNASYKFVGWFMEDGTKITSDNASYTERSGSYTFVARFMEVSSGQLVLSHSVGTGAKVSIDGHNYTCDGSGSASIGAVITDAETGEVLKTYDVANKDITIDEKYIGSDKNYNITVTLIAQADTNTAQGTTKLTNTSDTVTENDFFNPKTGTDSGKQRTFTFTFNVKDKLYSGTTQKTMSLIYNSYFIQYKFNYQINYTFKDRTGDTKQYKRIGTLTPAEANTYVKKVDSSRYLDKSFIEKMAPAESNFGQNISWTFGDYLISTGGEDGSNYEYNIDAHYTATQTEIAKRNVTFVLPYAHDEYGVATLDGEGKGTKETSENLEFVDKRKSNGSDERVTFAQIPVLKGNKRNGIYTEEEKSHWIAAPQTIKDGNKELTFRYWSIKTTDHCTAEDPDVSRCYFPGFNFIAYDNYVIEAIYGDTSALPSEYGKNTNITYVETTRNQWNSNGTDYSKDQRTYASDLLYNDFIVSYSLDGKEIYSGEADNDIEDIGIVVERIKALDTKQDGSLDTTLSKYTDIVERPDVVDSVIKGGTVTGFSRHSITKNSNGGYKLDNKDRYNIYDAFYNSAGWKQTTTGGNPAANYTYKNYVYRAYSYMKLTDGTIVKSSPAYFTMYDVATANYSSN